jgi:hypothetical protein
MKPKLNFIFLRNGSLKLAHDIRYGTLKFRGLIPFVIYFMILISDYGMSNGRTINE